MKDLPTTLVLPVSGQNFIHQMAILTSICSKGYKPEVSMGASGGALVIAQGLSNNWNVDSWIKEVEETYNIEVIRKYPLSYIQSLFEPSIYLRGSGLLEYYQRVVNKSLRVFRENELIINAYNTSSSQTELFSTVSKEKSILDGEKAPLRLLGVSNVINYLGHLPDDQYREKLLQVLLATGAVAVLFTMVNIDGSEYSDGGICFSSPLTPVNSMLGLTEVLYINPSNLDKPSTVNYGNVLETAVAAASQASYSNAIQDRYTFLQSLSCGDFAQLKVLSGTLKDGFDEDLKKTKSRNRMVELFPLGGDSYSMIDQVNRASRLEVFFKNFENFGYRIFYLSG